MYTCFKFDRGRNCLRYLVKTFCIKEIHIPYYLCDVIRHTLFQENCKPLFYHIDDNFLPEKQFNKEDFVLYPNYFGVFKRNVHKLVKIYPKLIIDNAHAFYDEPVGFASFNSGIKFGYGENAYLWIKNDNEILSNSQAESQPVFKIDMKQKCRNRFFELHKIYSGINKLNINLTNDEYPFAYPLLATSIEKADNLVKNLSKQNITIYRYWNSLPKNFNEYKFYSRLVPIPTNHALSAQ